MGTLQGRESATELEERLITEDIIVLGEATVIMSKVRI